MFYEPAQKCIPEIKQLGDCVTDCDRAIILLLLPGSFYPTVELNNNTFVLLFSNLCYLLFCLKKDRFHSITFVHVFTSAAAQDGSTVLCIFGEVTTMGSHIFGILGVRKFWQVEI